MNTKAIRELFDALSGVNGISERQIGSGFKQMTERAGESKVEKLVEKFQSDGLDGIREDKELLGLAQATTYWLYTGIFPDEQGESVKRGSSEKPTITDPEDYFESLVWRVIQAHPRALSGGYFGHWHYPPEDSDA